MPSLLLAMSTMMPSLSCLEGVVAEVRSQLRGEQTTFHFTLRRESLRSNLGKGKMYRMPVISGKNKIIDQNMSCH